MNIKQSNQKTTILLSYLFFAVLFILSLFFWKERAIAFDAAFQVFKVIDTGGLAIQVERFGATVVQVFPLILTELGASMDLILQSYSASFVLYPLLLFAITVSLVKNPRMGFSIVLFFLLLQVHTFYWIQSELIQGCVFSLFFISIFSKWPKPSIVGILAYSLGTVIILYAHPLGIIALLFGMGYLFIDSSTYRNRTFAGVIFTLLAVGIYKYKFARIGTYDTRALGMFDGFEERIGNIFSLVSTDFFFERLLSTYYLLLIGFIVVCIFFITQKQWLKLAWVFTAITGWLALILTTYHWGVQQFYIESFYLMLGLFIAVPIAWDIWPNIQIKWLAPILLSTLITIRVAQIWEGKKVYQQRLAWTTEKLATMNTFEEQRFYIPKASIPMYTIQLEWSIPYEMLLLSSLNEQTQGLKTLYIMQDQDNEEDIINMKDGLLTGFGEIKYHWLSDRFRMSDTLKVRKLE